SLCCGTPSPRPGAGCRKYCPPGAGAASTSVTRVPRRAAARAAAIPAGPAPITASSVLMTGALLRADDVPRAHRDQAGPLVGAVVDGDEAVEADADAAEHPAGASAVPGGAPGG